MAHTRTAADLITELRALTDVRSNRWSDVILTRLLNTSLAKLYDQVVDINPDFWLQDHSFTIVSGTSDYILYVVGSDPPPAPWTDFYRAHGVDVLDSDGKWYSIRRFNWEERNLGNEGASYNTDRRSTRYRIIGGDPAAAEYGGYLRLSPTPGWSGETVKLWYVPAPPTLAGTVDFMGGWEDFILYDAAEKICAADESDGRPWAKLKAEAWQRISSAASSRDESHADRVRDVRLTRYHEERLPRP